MLEALGRQLIQSGFLPHGYCLSWSPSLVGTYIFSDTLIALSYFSMPVAMAYFGWKRPDFSYKWMLWMFVAFILSCGTTHLMGTVILYQPAYWLDASLRVITGIVSAATAISLWPMIPKALSVPSHEQMRAINGELQQEITERRRIEEELKRAHEELKELHRLTDASLSSALHRLDAHMGNSPLAVIEFDPELRVMRWSDAAEELFGWQADEVVGKAIGDFRWTHEGDAEKLAQISAAMLSGTSPRNKNVSRNYCKDGTVVYCEWYNSAIYDEDRRLVSILSQVLDITRYKEAVDEIKRLNADLEQRVEERTAELKEANRELDSFAYAVSHDLRAPLRAINGFSQILEESWAGQLNGDALRYLQQIRLSSRKMSDLIDGILTLSRITRDEPRRDEIDLTAMARRLLEGLAAAEPQRQVKWEIEPGLVTLGDIRMVESVMTNLIDNAWKYTAKTPDASIRVYREGENFCVADNGAGFDPSHAEKLFQPFQRLHGQGDFPGIGIGLATVHRIVQRHGGDISVTAAPGGGATFRFNLGNY